eukprot:7051114-Pyramimonas_sp.AAC.1
MYAADMRPPCRTGVSSSGGAATMMDALARMATPPTAPALEAGGEAASVQTPSEPKSSIPLWATARSV